MIAIEPSGYWELMCKGKKFFGYEFSLWHTQFGNYFNEGKIDEKLFKFFCDEFGKFSIKKIFFLVKFFIKISDEFYQKFY